MKKFFESAKSTILTVIGLALLPVAVIAVVKYCVVIWNIFFNLGG